MDPRIHALRSIVQTSAASDGYTYCTTNCVYQPLPTELDAPPAEFRNEWFEIVKDINGKWKHGIANKYAWDGCSHASDFVWPFNLQAVLFMAGEGRDDDATAAASPLLGSMLHDPGYQFVVEIAKAWGWSIAKTLRWFNRAFRAVMLDAGATRCKAWRYYWGVSIVGYPYNWMGRHNVTLNPLKWF